MKPIFSALSILTLVLTTSVANAEYSVSGHTLISERKVQDARSGEIHARTADFEQFRYINGFDALNILVWNETPILPLARQIEAEAVSLGGSPLVKVLHDKGYLLDYLNMVALKSSPALVEEFRQKQDAVFSMSSRNEPITIRYSYEIFEQTAFSNYPIDKMYCEKTLVPRMKLVFDDETKLLSALTFEVYKPAHSLIISAVESNKEACLAALE